MHKRKTRQTCYPATKKRDTFPTPILGETTDGPWETGSRPDQRAAHKLRIAVCSVLARVEEVAEGSSFVLAASPRSCLRDISARRMVSSLYTRGGYEGPRGAYLKLVKRHARTFASSKCLSAKSNLGRYHPATCGARLSASRSTSDDSVSCAKIKMSTMRN